jgi:hypothetical protein
VPIGRSTKEHAVRGRIVTTVAALAIAGAVGGCSKDPGPAPKPDNTAEVCAEYVASTHPESANQSPETKAYNKLIADSYVGKADPTSATSAPIVTAYYAAMSRDTRALAERATRKATRDAFNGLADAMKGMADHPGGIPDLTKAQGAVTAACFASPS